MSYNEMGLPLVDYSANCMPRERLRREMEDTEAFSGSWQSCSSSHRACASSGL